ncbi:MAG: hypothetical protein CVV44_15310 [Spirochaetae bacterium HGW-Spirochaetae-1]|jgi:cephalosporin-C deacetylase-like acetyl esterase|nr:MAG: hypothetical protein CVV44_15310 [Spirochaetae bacterium HGW-Spirochaetae-1]
MVEAAMALTDFDRYFQNLPDFDREKDFMNFWQKAMTDLKKIPLEPEVTKNSKKSDGSFSVFDVTFRSFMKTQVSGYLLKPKKVEKPPVIIYVHDYNRVHEINTALLRHDTAYFFPTLRGHNFMPAPEKTEQTSPGYLIENILDKETYYIKAVYLDILRSIDTLRLIKDINCGRIGIIGKGLGAAVALFASAFSDRIVSLVLDTPSFCNLTLSQNISTSEAAREINDFITLTRGKKKQIKTTLTYFDALNFADLVQCPVLTTVGFRDTQSPPDCIFGLFNNLLCDKTIEVYPDEGNSAGGEKQFTKSLDWLMEKINS